MTRAHKIILLAAATLIIYFILFPPDPDDWITVININGHNISDFPWFEVVLVAVVAIVAFLAAEKKPPAGKE